MTYHLTQDGLGITAYLPGDSEQDIATGQHYYVPLLKAEWSQWQRSGWLISKEQYQAVIELCLAALKESDVL